MYPNSIYFGLKVLPIHRGPKYILFGHMDPYKVRYKFNFWLLNFQQQLKREYFLEVKVQYGVAFWVRLKVSGFRVYL